MQEEDAILCKVKEYVSKGERPSGKASKQLPHKIKRWFRDWERLILDQHGVLKRNCVTIGGNKVKQICLPTKLHKMVFEELHEKMGHLGADRVVALAREIFTGLE